MDILTRYRRSALALAAVVALLSTLITFASSADAQDASTDPVTALVVRQVPDDVATFTSTRDAYVADLESQPGITADREFQPFISFLTFGQPTPPVFIGLTSGTSLGDFQAAAEAVDPSLVEAYFPTFDNEFFDFLVPLDGAPLDITQLANQPGQVLEVAWRDLSSYENFDQSAYESARDAYLEALGERDGWVAEYQWVSATGQPFAVGMTVYENQEKFVSIATDADFMSSDVYTNFVGAYPIAGGYASLSVKPGGAAEELAFTGTNTAGLAIAGTSLLVAGALVLHAGRRRELDYV